MFSLDFIYHINNSIDSSTLKNLYKVRANLNGTSSRLTEIYNLNTSRPISPDAEKIVKKIQRVDFTFSEANTFISVSENNSTRVRKPSCDFLDKNEEIPNLDNIFTFIKSSFSRKEKEGSANYEYPSAGGIYGVQLFFLVKGSSEWSLYHLLKDSGSFELVKNVKNEFVKKYLYDSENVKISSADFIIFYTIIPCLSVLKYKERGYKFSLIETGAMMQLASVNSHLFGYGSRAYGYYDEHAISKLLGLNPKNFWVEGVQLFKGIAND